MAKRFTKILINSAAAVAALAASSSWSRADLQLLAAPEVDLRDCDYSGANHSKEVTSNELVQQCHQAVLEKASGPANRWSTDSSLHVFGYHGMLFIDHFDFTNRGSDGSAAVKHGVVSGRNVVFRNVDAVAIDESRQEIYVLDASTQTISVYPTSETGDVYPRRKIVSKDLADAAALAIDEKQGELLVLYPKSSTVLAFGRMASSDGRRTENSTEVKRRVDLSALTATGSMLTDIAASTTYSELFVFDRGGGKIVAFDRGLARPVVKFSYPVAGVVDGAQYILYSGKEDTIRAMRSDGSGHEYVVRRR